MGDTGRNVDEKRRIAALKLVSSSTSGFPFETISAKEVISLEQQNQQRVILIDTRTVEEMQVSMIPGAISANDFEHSDLYLQPSDEEKTHTLLVPYCTVGYRSAVYCEKLKSRGFQCIRNSEGVVMWTHDCDPLHDLVQPPKRHTDTDTGTGKDKVNGSEEGEKNEPQRRPRVHTFGSKWALASSRYDISYFSTSQVIWRSLVAAVTGV